MSPTGTTTIRSHDQALQEAQTVWWTLLAIMKVNMVEVSAEKAGIPVIVVVPQMDVNLPLLVMASPIEPLDHGSNS